MLDAFEVVAGALVTLTEELVELAFTLELEVVALTVVALEVIEALLVDTPNTEEVECASDTDEVETIFTPLLVLLDLISVGPAATIEVFEEVFTVSLPLPLALTVM